MNGSNKQACVCVLTLRSSPSLATITAQGLAVAQWMRHTSGTCAEEEVDQQKGAVCAQLRWGHYHVLHSAPLPGKRWPPDKSFYFSAFQPCCSSAAPLQPHRNTTESAHLLDGIEHRNWEALVQENDEGVP